MSSDAFFEFYNPSDLLQDLIDTAFIDGMHLFEFVLRDFMNVEKSCHDASIIALHDCLPPTFEMTNREFKHVAKGKYKDYWTGDVWKLPYLLQTHRPDLRLAYLDCPPTGLVVVSNCDPSSKILSELPPDVIKQFAEAGIAELHQFAQNVYLDSSQELDRVLDSLRIG